MSVSVGAAAALAVLLGAAPVTLNVGSIQAWPDAPPSAPAIAGNVSWAGTALDNQSGLSVSHNHDAGLADGLLVVAGIIDNFGAETPGCGATYDGVAMTELAGMPSPRTAVWPYFSAYFAADPPAGAHEVAFSCGAPTLDAIQLIAIDVDGADGIDTAFHSNAGGSGTSDTLALTTAANALVIGVQGVRSGNEGVFTWSAPAVEIVDLPSTSGPGSDITTGIAWMDRPVAGPTSMFSSWAPSNRHEHLILALVGPGGGAPPDPPDPPDPPNPGLVDLNLSPCFTGLGLAQIDLAGQGGEQVVIQAQANTAYDARGELWTRPAGAGAAALQIANSPAGTVCVVGMRADGEIPTSRPYSDSDSSSTGAGMGWNFNSSQSNAPLMITHGFEIERTQDPFNFNIKGGPDATFLIMDGVINEGRDDGVQDDGCMGGTIRDVLVPKVHMYISTRPGGSVSSVNMGAEQNMIRWESTAFRLACQMDTRSDGSCDSNNSHSNGIKTSGTGWPTWPSSVCETSGGDPGPRHVMDGTDQGRGYDSVIFMAEDVSRNGIDSMIIPIGTDLIGDVFYIYYGPDAGNHPANGYCDTDGDCVTFITDPAVGDPLWNGWAEAWATAHGCGVTYETIGQRSVVGRVDNCTFLDR
ncbi:MAG TPA: hypothetical protein VMX97_04565 [Hyphomicrobiaceae bacterium]|nr:hypothetical protein [Hyphomicrobiaceae bacterium]